MTHVRVPGHSEMMDRRLHQLGEDGRVEREAQVWSGQFTSGEVLPDRGGGVPVSVPPFPAAS